MLVILKKNEYIKCLKTYDITWFPPYMKEVDEIDYNKFPLDIRKAVKKVNKNSSNEIQKILNKQKDSN